MTQLEKVLDRVFRPVAQETGDEKSQLLWSVFRWFAPRMTGADIGHQESPHIMWKQHADQRNAVPLDYAGMSQAGDALYGRFMDPKSGKIIRLTLEVESQ